MERPPSQRTQSAAVLAPVLGLFLLMPPFVTLFTGMPRPLGVPLIVAYIFGVWAALLVVTFVLARRLSASEPKNEAQTGLPGEDAPHAPIPPA